MLKIDKALIQQFIGGNFGLPTAYENSGYKPVAGVAYAEINVMPNDVTAMALVGRDQTDGVFQIILRYPANVGAVPVKTKADEIFAQFKIGQQLTYGGVKVWITSHKRGQGIIESVWYKIVLTLNYKSFLTR